MMDSSKVRVNIFGNYYTVQGEASGDYIARLASFVDSKMNEVSRSVNTANTVQIAILAALNIADEYFQLKEIEKGIDENVAKRANELITLLEQGLIGDFSGYKNKKLKIDENYDYRAND
mgnify:FL=1